MKFCTVKTTKRGEYYGAQGYGDKGRDAVRVAEDLTLSPEQNHREAARALAARRGWETSGGGVIGIWVPGAGSVMVWAGVEDAQAARNVI